MLQVMHWAGSNFNALSPRGERLRDGMVQDDLKAISIHSPRVGRDIAMSGGMDTG